MTGRGKYRSRALLICLILGASVVAVGTVTAAEDGKFTVDVEHDNGNQATEVNALVIYQDGSHYKTVKDYSGIDLTYTFSNLPLGHDYRVNAYIHDQYAGTTGTVTISSDTWWTIGDESTASKTITAENPVSIRPTVTYDDGSTPLEGATVEIRTHEDVMWRSAATDSNGGTDPEQLWVYPTNSGYYDVTVSYDGQQVASKRLDSLSSNRDLAFETSVSVPEYDLSVSSSAGGTVDASATGSIEKGTSVSLTAESTEGYRFDHWSGSYPSGSYTDPSIQVTMDEDKDLTAHFEQIEGDLSIDVVHQNGDRATEVNGLVVWQDEVSGEPYREITNKPGIDLPKTVSDLPGDHEYKVSAYINDQFAGSTDWVSITDSDRSRTLTVSNSVWIRPSVTYADGSTPLEGATVEITSQDDVTWRGGTTGSDGVTDPEQLWIYPTNSGYYDVTVSYDGQQVASKRLDSLSSGRDVELTTSVEGTIDGEITGYQSPTDGSEYELDRWYDVTVGVRNTGTTVHTFTVQAPPRTGRETRTETKTITLAAGESGTVTFQQRWYGTYTTSRAFSHDLLADTDDDGSRETLDESTVTLTEPPNGEIELVPNTGDGDSASIDVTVADTSSGETAVDTTITTDGTDVSGRQYSVRTGTYDVTVNADGYRSRTKTVTIEDGRTRIVEPLLAPRGVDATIDGETLAVESGQFTTGETVTASVDVTNTGSETWEFFVGFSVRHSESDTSYSNAGQTGQFVELAPGETKTVPLEWRVDDSALSGSYDAVGAVWYGYPEDGADQIQSTEWVTDAFDVTSARTETVDYDGGAYTIEHRSDNTVAVYDSSGDPVSADRAESVLRYTVFRTYALDNVTEGWWKAADEATSLEKYYWMAHLNEAAITGYKAYVNAHFGGYKDSIGEFIDLSMQATDLMRNHHSGSTYEWLHDYSQEAQQLYDLYSGGQATGERLSKTVSVVKKARKIKRTSDSVDSMADALARAEESSDIGDTVQGIVIEAGMAPLNDVSAGLTTTRKQSFISSHWGKTSKPILQMLDELEEKRKAGTITPREMRLFYLLQVRFHSSQVKLWNRMAALQKHGEQNSYAFGAISSFHGNSPEKFRDLANGSLTLVDLKLESMGEYLNRSSSLVNRSVNVRDDPKTTQLDTPEPLVVNAPAWSAPSESATVHVESRGEPVINAEVSVGDRIVETDRDGNATVTFWDTGTYDAEVTKDGFKSATTSLLVREPEVADTGFTDVSVGHIEDDTRRTRSTTMENTGETPLDIADVSASHAGVTASVDDGTADPGESLSVVVDIDPGAFEPGAFATDVTVGWANVDGTTTFTVSGNYTGTEYRPETFTETFEDGAFDDAWEIAEQDDETITETDGQLVHDSPSTYTAGGDMVSRTELRATGERTVTVRQRQAESSYWGSGAGIEFDAGGVRLKEHKWGQNDRFFLQVYGDGIENRARRLGSATSSTSWQTYSFTVDFASGTITSVTRGDETHDVNVDISDILGDSYRVRLGNGRGHRTLYDSVRVSEGDVSTPNRPPTATNRSLSTKENTTVSGSFTGTDPDGDSLSYTVVDEPEHGDVQVTDEAFTYTPDVGFTGSDEFRYRASDGHGGTDTATVEIFVDGTSELDVGIDVQQEETVTQGADATISAYPYNRADNPVTEATLALAVDANGDGQFEASVTNRTVDIDAGESRELTLRYENVTLAPGEYRYSVRLRANGQTERRFTNGTLTVETDETEPTVSVEPAQQTVTVEETVEYDIAVAGIDNGVDSYEFTAALSNGSTATITDVTLVGTSADNELTAVDYGTENASVSVAAVSADHDAGVIGTITIEGQTPGTASLSIRDPRVWDDEDTSYAISAVDNGSITVTERTTPVVVGESPVRDLDNDGTFEDINGDGTFNIVDVNALFQNRDSQAVTDNGHLFDANGDGSFDLADISLLFERVQA